MITVLHISSLLFWAFALNFAFLLNRDFLLYNFWKLAFANLKFSTVLQNLWFPPITAQIVYIVNALWTRKSNKFVSDHGWHVKFFVNLHMILKVWGTQSFNSLVCKSWRLSDYEVPFDFKFCAFSFLIIFLDVSKTLEKQRILSWILNECNLRIQKIKRPVFLIQLTHFLGHIFKQFVYSKTLFRQ